MKSLSEQFDCLFNNKVHVGILFLRIFVGSRLIYGTVDNIVSVERMAEFESFLHQNGFPNPALFAFISVYLQFVGGLFVLVGFKTRSASFLLMVNFIIALVFVHIRSRDSIEAMTPALAMFFGCLTLIFTGAEKISLDDYIKSRRTK